MAVIQANIKAAKLALYNQAKTTEMTEEEFADAEATIEANAILSAEISPGTTANGVTAGGASVPVTGGLI